MSMPVTIKVPVNAKSCIQMAYDVLLSPENLLAKKLDRENPPYMDTILLHAFVVHDKYEYFVTAKEIGQNESEMTVICVYKSTDSLAIHSPGYEYKSISYFLRSLSQKIQDTI